MVIRKHVYLRQPFLVAGVIMLCLIILPTLFSLNKLFVTSDKWSFIVENLLVTYISQSFVLVICVVLLASVIGIFGAVIVTKYSFKGRRLIELLLYLPMAIPPYVLSYLYVDTLAYQGRLHRLFSLVGITLNIDVFSMLLAIIVLSLSLFPYVYIPMKSYFKNRNNTYDEVAKLLHVSTLKRMFSIHIPLLFPALFSGAMFVLFEAMNDYGVSKYLNIKTLTVGMFDTWFQLNDMTAAFYLAFIYIGFISVFTIMYQMFSKHQFVHDSNRLSQVRRVRLKGFKKYMYFSLLFLIILVSLFIPMIELFLNMLIAFEASLLMPFIQAFMNTLFIAFASSVLIMMSSVLVANFYRFASVKWMKKLSSVFVFGYALPGVMIALIYYVFFIELDTLLEPIYDVLGLNGLFLSLSSVMIVVAMTFRFFAIGYRQTIVSYESIGMTHTLSSYTLNTSKLKTLIFIDIPMIRKGLIAGFIISFIDIAKELPMTLLLRPFNVQTLSTLTFTYINNEDIAKASLPSFALVLMSMTCVYLLTRQRKGSHVS